ncbi:MAG: histidine kinase [Gemmatimonadota bacterium]
MTTQTSGATRRPPVALLISAAWIVPAILGVINAYAQARLDADSSVSWRSLLWEGGDWLLYGLLTPAVLYLARKFPLRGTALARHLMLHLVAALGLCVAWASAGTVLRGLLLPGAHSFTWEFILSWTLTTLPFGVSVYFAVLGIEHAFHYYAQSQEREAQAARLSVRLAEARLGALRMQIQPHFLLNSLNAITVLVRDRDTATATGMLERLGEVLRRVLSSDRGREVPLSEELEFLGQYLQIEQVRFSDRLRVTIDSGPEVANALVPDFILQPLIENAIRHGIASRSEAGRIVIAARRADQQLVITVQDDGPGPGTSEREGVGLTNTRERLAMLYGNQARLELTSAAGGGALATLRLPYRTGADV